MAGILSPCAPMLFPMKCDIYYATDEQTELGAMKRNWQFDETRFCSFYTRDDETNNKNFEYGEKKFYNFETVLFGRTQTDIRKSSEGVYIPISHILITNIRNGDCENEDLLFYETNMKYDPVPIIFEAKMIQPYINAFNKIEYFKIELMRSDIQVFE